MAIITFNIGIGVGIGIGIVLMPLFRVRQKLTLEMAETHMRRMRVLGDLNFAVPSQFQGS